VLRTSALLFATVAAFAGALAAAPAQAHAGPPAHHTRRCPSAAEINRMAAAGANAVPGFGQYLESCVVHRRMRRLFKRCMVAFGLTAGAVGIGSLILQLPARIIAGEMISAGAGACINELVN
jgi:hypothetical protein